MTVFRTRFERDSAETEVPMRSRRSGSPVKVTVVSAVFVATMLAAPQVRAQDTAPEVQNATRKLVEYQTKNARAALEPVTGRAKTDGAVAVALGRVLEQEKKYDEAVNTLGKAAELRPADPAPQVFLGETYVHAKRYGDAEAAFGRAAKLGRAAAERNAQDAAAWYYLGVAQLRLKQYDDAFASLTRARDTGFDGALVLFQQGATRVLQGKWAEAAELLTRALEENSGIAYAYYYRGLAQDKLGKKDQLVLDMDRFLKLAPQAPEADRAQAVVKAAKR
jgi:tetratricopeptide (TPR) repeat protein